MPLAHGEACVMLPWCLLLKRPNIIMQDHIYGEGEMQTLSMCSRIQPSLLQDWTTDPSGAMGFRVPEPWSLKDRDVLTEGPRSSGIFKNSWRRSPLAQMSRSWSCLHTFFSHIFVLNYPFLFLWFSNFLPLNFLFFLLLNLVIIYFCHN